MTSKAPPVPSENRSSKGPGDRDSSAETRNEAQPDQADFDKQGQQGNSKINTTRQGGLQDR